MVRWGRTQKLLDALASWKQSWLSSWAPIPVRRIYLRAGGRRLRCISFGPRLQIVGAAFSLLLLAWIAFASANLIAANRIIAGERLRSGQTQALYAAQIKLIKDLQAKQDALAAIIEHRERIDSTLRLPGRASGRPSASTPKGIAPAASYAEPQTKGLARDARQNAPAPKSGAAALRKESFLRGARDYMTSLLTLKRDEAGVVDAPTEFAMQPEQKSLAALDDEQRVLLRELTEDLESENKRLGRALENTGIAPERFMALPDREAAEPLGVKAVLASDSLAEGGDQEYFAQLATAADSLDALEYAAGKMNTVPLGRPIDVDYGISSGFGVRRDPFTRRRAFHEGLDFSGPWGTTVRATAPGVVTYAARKGGYGNTVEIDHGSGIRTRYGHLRSILVRNGTKVERGTPVGRLGSTGRSTGPHIHYEVWYGNAPKNPQRFIEAGQLLFRP